MASYQAVCSGPTFPTCTRPSSLLGHSFFVSTLKPATATVPAAFGSGVKKGKGRTQQSIAGANGAFVPWMCCSASVLCLL
eukprot:1162051-Pelagomonas_calceolata.AAC.4